MSRNRDPLTEEQLDLHIAALRDEAVGDGPPAESLAKAQAMLRAMTGRRNVFERLVTTMTFSQRIAAVVMITLGGLTLYVLFGLFSALAPSVAFADVVNKFTARTLVFTSTTTMPGKPPVVVKTLASDPDRTRSEMPDGAVSIRNGHSFLILNPQNKSATLTNMTQPAGEPATPKSQNGMVGALRSLGGLKGEPLGARTINGVETVGFRTKAGGGRHLDVWANKKTAMPVRVEMSLDAGGGETSVVMDHFEIDPQLDESLFSLDPPKGYKLSTQDFAIPLTQDVEVAVVEILRIYAAAKAGAFPDSLQDWAALFSVTTGDASAHQKLLGMAGSYTALTSTLECRYTGKGARLGDKEKIVFWYHKDGKPPTYRAIYGDLRVEDVEKEELPATQPAK